ncbi:MAG: ABC transporter permease [Cyclobacteriaceae bacterium]
MNNKVEQLQLITNKYFPFLTSVFTASPSLKTAHPFSVMVQKEIGDHVKSWRFFILIGIIFFTCIGALYTALSNTQKLADPTNTENAFFFLKLFTVSDGSLPPFFILLGFLGPLLGLSLGFDAINSEQNRGTLSRILAQPVPRDYIINAKFIASLLVISAMIFALTSMVFGAGLVAIGIPPTADEFLRIISFTIVSIIYISFWLNLSVLFSIRFKQPATSALSGIAAWLFFTIFYPLFVNVLGRVLQPGKVSSRGLAVFVDKLQAGLVQIMPGELYNQSVSALLMPSVRSLGPLTMEQMQGSIPGPLPFGQSLLIIWPQLTGIITFTLLCFVFSYVSFMRKEIRSR